MNLELEKQLPDGYELVNENPESVNLDSDKTHVIMRFAVKPIDETNQDNQNNDWLKTAKHLANNYAYAYSFVRGDDMPRAQQALFDHLESIVKPIKKV